MKKQLFHQWQLLLFFPLIVLMSCGRKNYPAVNTAEMGDKYESTKSLPPAPYIPAAVITISDEAAKTNRDGEMYYDDENGYRYWRSADGKYYLDNRYSTGAKKLSKKKIKRSHRQSNTQEYSHQ